MKIIVNDQPIAFDVSGSGQNVILLHGWGANRYTFNNLYKHLSKNYRTYIIDLPGFGESDEPKTALSIEELCDLIFAFVIKLNIYDPIILGHSYGGRIAIKYASKYSVKKLILVSSAGIKQELTFKKKTSQKIYKFLKKYNIKLNLGSKDFKNASLIKKQMLVKAVNEDQSEDLKLIKCSTLLIWGSQDNTTKIVDAKKMKELISNSGLVIIKDASHFPYLDNFTYFALVLDSYLGCDDVD